MTHTLKLKALLVANGLTQEDIANSLGISKQSVFMKIHNKREFKASEINKLYELLQPKDMQEWLSIFFANCVELNSTSA